MLTLAALALLASAPLALANPIDKRCTGTISSLADVAAAKKCTTININALTVPSGTLFDLSNLLAGTTVNLQGDVKFNGGSLVEWEGPMFLISGDSVTFQGNAHTFDGQGGLYWDTKGSNDGTTKPKFLKVSNSGSFTNLNVKNPPVQVFSVGSNKAALAITNVHINVADGNTLKNGKPLAHNTDCFDVSADDVTISGSTCLNQDDCLALNSGTNFKFDGNTCTGGHGISIGSIKTGKVVDGVTISNNKVINNTNGLRIKTYDDATQASVSNVNYIGNTITGATDYGVVIQQDYENKGSTGVAGNSVPIKNVNFSGATTSVSVTGSDAKEVYVLCGTSSCSGTWNWSSLKTSGEKVASTAKPDYVKTLIKGYTVA